MELRKYELVSWQLVKLDKKVLSSLCTVKLSNIRNKQNQHCKTKPCESSNGTFFVMENIQKHTWSEKKSSMVAVEWTILHFVMPHDPKNQYPKSPSTVP